MSTYDIYVMCHVLITCRLTFLNPVELRIADFSAAEVDEFRGLFMEHSTEDGLPGSFKNRPWDQGESEKMLWFTVTPTTSITSTARYYY